MHRLQDYCGSQLHGRELPLSLLFVALIACWPYSVHPVGQQSYKHVGKMLQSVSYAFFVTQWQIMLCLLSVGGCTLPTVNVQSRSLFRHPRVCATFPVLVFGLKTSGHTPCIVIGAFCDVPGAKIVDSWYLKSCMVPRRIWIFPLFFSEKYILQPYKRR